MSDAAAPASAVTAAGFPRLHVLTPSDQGPDDLRLVDAALAAGAPAIQVRVKDATDRVHLEVVRAVVARCRAAGAWSIVNDRVDLALVAGADAVHLGAHDLPVADARALAGDRLRIGGTARDPAQARALVAAGADYLGVGPTFATRTKDGLPDPLGVAGVAAVVEAVEVPVVAIAGITLERLAEVLASGADGVAVVGAVTQASDPGQATRDLLDALRRHGRP
ncbi:MAG: thiamine phosphate synthase [Nitriliruptoraceae bacterium]|nr:thiamine phosphate synthase [Nitriliruptoraceae bacterium]